MAIQRIKKASAKCMLNKGGWIATSLPATLRSRLKAYSRNDGADWIAASAAPSDGTTGETTSHLTRLSKNDSQVIGYSQSTGETTSHPTKQPKDGCQVVGYKPASGQVAGYRKDTTSAYMTESCRQNKLCPTTVVHIGLVTTSSGRYYADSQLNPINPLGRRSSIYRAIVDKNRAINCAPTRWLGSNELSGLNKELQCPF